MTILEMARTASRISDPLDRLEFCRTFERTHSQEESASFKEMLQKLIRSQSGAGRSAYLH